jgi:4-amino-4-deoxy-L-arabinose transferase-like glycosyltransferase
MMAYRYGPLAFLVTLSAALFLHYRLPFMIGYDWDSFEYLSKIVRGERYSLGLGRIGYLFFHWALWNVAHAILQIPVTDAFAWVQAVTIVTTILIVPVFYYFARAYGGNRVAFIASVLLIFSPTIISHASKIFAETLTILLLYSSILSYYMGIRERKVSLRLLGCVLFALTIEVRETAVIFFPFFIFLSVFEGKHFIRENWKNLSISLLLPFIIVLAGFILMSLYDPQFLKAFRQWTRYNPTSFRSEEVLARLNSILFLLWNYFPLISILFVLSLADYVLCKNWRSLILISTLTLLPLLHLTTVHYPGGHYLRWFLPAVPGLCLSAALVLSKLLNRLSLNMLAQAIIVISLAAATVNIQYLNYERRAAAETKSYGQFLMNTVPPEALLIVGHYCSMVHRYYTELGIRDGWAAVWPGWGWREFEVPLNRVNEALAHNIPVFVDLNPELYPGSTSEPIKQQLNMFKLMPVDKSLYRIVKPSGAHPPQ